MIDQSTDEPLISPSLTGLNPFRQQYVLALVRDLPQQQPKAQLPNPDYLVTHQPEPHPLGLVKHRAPPEPKHLLQDLLVGRTPLVSLKTQLSTLPF